MNLSDREQQVLALISDDPMLSQLEIAQRLKLSRSAVAGHIMRLGEKGVIRGRGYVFNSSQYVVVIGGANMDIHGVVGGPLVANDSNPGKVHSCAGGVARNIAAALARMHVDCRLITALGNDSNGDDLVRDARALGIDMGYTLRVPNRPTSTYLSVLDEHGDTHIAVADMGIMDALDVTALKAQQAMLQRASAIIIETNLSDAALSYLSNEFADRPIFVDTVSATKAPRIAAHLKNIYSLKLSWLEAQALIGIEHQKPTKSNLASAAKWCHEQGVKRVFITLGANGVFFSDMQAQSLIKPKRKNLKIRNTVGAGDTFLAGLVYADLQSWSSEYAVNFGMAAAELVLADTDTGSLDLSLDRIQHVMTT